MDAYDRLERLLLTTPIDQLSEEEQHFVKQHLSPEAYIRQRKTLLASRKLLAQDMRVPTHLAQAPRLTVESPPLSLSPWLLVAACLLLPLAFYLGRLSITATPPPSPIIQQRLVRDTVYMPQIIERTAPVQVVEKIVRDTIYVPAATDSIDSFTIPLAKTPPPAKGLNAQESSRVLEVAVEVY